MHALRRALLPRAAAAAGASRCMLSAPVRDRCLARAAASAGSSSPLPERAKSEPRRRRRPPTPTPPAPPPSVPSPLSPSSLLLELGRSARFSRDAELLACLADLDRASGEQGGGGGGGEEEQGPLLTLGAGLWLRSLREGHNADRAGIAEALARLGARGGPALFGAVCRAVGVPRRTVGAAVGVLDVLAGGRGEDEDEEEGRAWLVAAPSGGGDGGGSGRGEPLAFTRQLHDACAREVRDLLGRRRARGGDESEDDDIDAGA